MAVGAVFFSLPMAFLAAIYGYASQGVTPWEMLVIYAAIGLGTLLTFTLTHGLRFDDLK